MKTTILTGLGIFGIFCSLTLKAQENGSFTPNSFNTLSAPGSCQSWADIGNVGKSDDLYTSFGNIPGSIGSHTDYLVATDFRFEIPVGAIISGFKVEVECSDPNSRTSDYSVRLLKNGVITSTEKAVGTPFPVSDGFLVYGGPFDLWGETWDYKFNDDNDFGIAIAAQRNGADNTTAGQVDNIRITVYYNLAVLPLTLTSFTASKENTTVLVKWASLSENSMDHYEVERSADGRSFQSLTSIPCRNEPAANYHFTDTKPLPGVSYYRLKMKGQSGYQRYSAVVAVSFNKENYNTLYPSPWRQGTTLNITNENNEKLFVYFYNSGGQVLSTATTESKQVPTGSLTNRKGLIHYKVYDLKKTLLGTGTLLIL